MKKITYHCDLCGQEVEQKNLAHIYGREYCSIKCFNIVTDLYDKALDHYEKTNKLVLANKVFLLHLLKNVDKNLWKKLFGTVGLGTLKDIVDEFQKFE